MNDCLFNKQLHNLGVDVALLSYILEVFLANYTSTYLRFKQDDVVASACLRYIHYEWQIMFNYPQPLFLKHSNKQYPFLILSKYT